MERPRLRDNRGRSPYELYPLGQIPMHNILEIGKWLACHYNVSKVTLFMRICVLFANCKICSSSFRVLGFIYDNPFLAYVVKH